MTIRVLLADDHAVMRDGLRVLLESEADVTVVGDVADGRQAVELTQQMCPDVVVMDIKMPQMDGIEATRRILDLCPATRVVILSMYAAPDQIFQALEAGVSGYVLKESAGREVIEAVYAVHAGRRYLSNAITEVFIADYVSRQRGTPKKEPSPGMLSARELEVLKWVVRGKTSSEIAGILGLSIKSVGTYRGRIMMKLGIRDVPGLVRFAIKHDLVAPEPKP